MTLPALHARLCSEVTKRIAAALRIQRCTRKWLERTAPARARIREAGGLLGEQVPLAPLFPHSHKCSIPPMPHHFLNAWRPHAREFAR